MIKKILKVFTKDDSADIAMERLQIIVARRKTSDQNSVRKYIVDMQQDLVNVVAKYVGIDNTQVEVHLEQSGGNDILEINIALPE